MGQSVANDEAVDPDKKAFKVDTCHRNTLLSIDNMTNQAIITPIAHILV